ncbi:MAG: hypothetical protein ACK5BM_04935 [Bacteroidota bacterium]
MEFLVALTPLAIFPAGTDTIFILCLIVLPALLVFFTAQYMMKQHITNSVQLVKTEILKTNLNTFTPLKLQAYERIALFLERTSIPALIQSYAQAGQSGPRGAPGPPPPRGPLSTWPNVDVPLRLGSIVTRYGLAPWRRHSLPIHNN